jgi:phospholipase A1
MKKKIVCVLGLMSIISSVQSAPDSTVPAPQNNVSNISNISNESVLEDKFQKKQEASKNPLSIILYRPTYILPYYYTGSPYTRIYATPQGQPPDNQKLMRNEFKAQLSLVVPVIPQLFHNPNMSFNLAYTQLNYWQIYASSQYFRETNYEPEVFIENHFHPNALFRMGLDHQSNGRGGQLERSWNRAISSVQVSGDNWLVGLRVWALIFQNNSSNLHNPDIAYYLGYENLLFSYKFHQARMSLELQNIESGLHRGNVMVTISYPVLKHLSLYAQYFNGYGQSLIEYNHRTQSAGVGITFNDWI